MLRRKKTERSKRKSWKGRATFLGRKLEESYCNRLPKWRWRLLKHSTRPRESKRKTLMIEGKGGGKMELPIGSFIPRTFLLWMGFKAIVKVRKESESRGNIHKRIVCKLAV